VSIPAQALTELRVGNDATVKKGDVGHLVGFGNMTLGSRGRLLKGYVTDYSNHRRSLSDAGVWMGEVALRKFFKSSSVSEPVRCPLPVSGRGHRGAGRHDRAADREKAKRDHAEVDPWLDKLPSAADAVRQIAEALERVARRLP
jgi:hypothetical protein